ncbi:glycosyltransferase 87 family protein [Aggregatilinea lenta]|uniref:glycosyltransferase 87 family protein n=1 Tax=Aggregatilinea lenta TaxID=913108 RepID=UPI000E5BC5D8|nr:glycosyltransferase 87 family protein [Aggregatilinea lenta]
MHLSRQKTSLLLILLGLWFVLTVTTQLWLIPKKMPHDYDLFPRWYGAREMLQGVNPYTDAVTYPMLKAMGYPLYDKYIHRFYYPATVTWILLPFWLLPFSLSIILWCGLQLLLVLVLPLLVFTLLSWRLPPLLLALITVFSAVPWRHSANSYVIGQYTIFILACLVISWWMVLEDRPWFAAIALVGSTVRSEGIVLTAALLLFLLLSRHYKVVMRWAGIMSVLFFLSVAQIGFWIPDFLHDIRGYEANQATTFAPAIFGVNWLTYLMIAIIVGWGIYMLYQMYSLPMQYRLPWSLSVFILVALLTLRQTKDYTLVYALLPIWIIAWAGRKQPWNTGGVLLILISPWIYNAVGANMGHDSQVEQFLTPVLLAGLLTYQWLRWKQPYTQPTSITVSTVSA